MQSATLEVQYAPISTRGYMYASFLEPFAFNTDVPLNFVAFVSRTPIQDVNIDSIGGYVESARLIERYWRIGLRYEYQETGPQNPQDLSTIELERFPKTAFPIQQAAIGPSLFYDRRDDILDPHKRLVLDGRRQVRVSAALGGRRRVTARSRARSPGSRASSAACSG